MRPKRHVLLCCADDTRRNDLAFLLRVRCTWARIEAFRTHEELMEAVAEDRPDFGCIILVAAAKGDCLPMPDGRMVREEDRLTEEIEFRYATDDAAVAYRTIEIQTGDRPSLFVSMARFRIHAGDLPTLIDVMQTACARKRGPKVTKD
jgi:hypothetical protein